MRTRLIGTRTEELDIAQLRARLNRRMDPAFVLRGDQLGGGAGRATPALKAASVLVPIVAREDGLSVILTQRTAHLRDHSGQISFPGGRAEPGDASPEYTALRETGEEIGLFSDSIEVIARLPDYHTRTGYRITPIVGIVMPPFDLRPDSFEVQEVFEVPLAFLLDPGNHRHESREFQGETRWYYSMSYHNHYIWGATAGMLVNMYRQLADAQV